MTITLDEEITRAVDILTRPPRLAVGSHRPGSGYGCIMNLLAWERYGLGEVPVRPDGQWEGDRPGHVDPNLRAILLHANDHGCRHKADTSEPVLTLCPDCARRVTRLGYQAVDTAPLGVPSRVTARIASLARLPRLADIGTPGTCQAIDGTLLDRAENFMALWWDYVNTEMAGMLAVREAEKIVETARRMETHTPVPEWQRAYMYPGQAYAPWEDVLTLSPFATGFTVTTNSATQLVTVTSADGLSKFTAVAHLDGVMPVPA